MKIFKLCRPYLLAHKYALTAYILIALAATSIGIVSPYIIGSFLDNLIYSADIRVILRFCAVFGGLSLLRIFKNYLTSWMYVKMRTQMAYALNKNAIQHVHKLSLSYINQQDSAYLNQRINNDSDTLIRFCISILNHVMSNIIIIVVPFMILLSINWFISVLLMGFLVVYIFLYFAFKESLYNAGFAFRETQSKLFSSLYEQLKYIKLIKVNSIQPEMDERVQKTFIPFKNAAIRNQKVSYLYSGLDGFISTIAQIILFVVGGIQILEGNFTIGMFTVFTSYFNMMLGASRYFFGLGESYQHTLTAYDRIMEIFRQTPESRGTKIIHDIQKISLHDVSFSYAGQKQIIGHFNMSFVKGKIYAVSGVNGAGKSTLINLILGLYIDEYSGTIAYDGVDIRQINMADVRKKLLGLAEQEPLLLNDSIRYNISFSPLDDTALLDEHIDMLNMRDFISISGLDFTINEKNTNTSGGEKQKIAILKVLHKNPCVMIFDEPTSALDAKTSQRFINYLQQIKKDRIILIITHDEAIKKLCDEAIVLSKL